jgi:REP element-mobilizing transposase RayT
MPLYGGHSKKQNLYKVGGHVDHLHILISLHPSWALADLVKDVKLSASGWIKDEKVFPHFSGWQDGYGAFTCSWKDKDRIANYIANQRKPVGASSAQDISRRIYRDAAKGRD